MIRERSIKQDLYDARQSIDQGRRIVGEKGNAVDVASALDAGALVSTSESTTTILGQAESGASSLAENLAGAAEKRVAERTVELSEEQLRRAAESDPPPA